MKLYMTLCIALSLLGTVLSGPMLYDDFATEQFDDRAEMSQNPQLNGDTQGEWEYWYKIFTKMYMWRIMHNT